MDTARRYQQLNTVCCCLMEVSETRVGVISAKTMIVTPMAALYKASG